MENRNLITHVATAGVDFIYGQLHVSDGMIRDAVEKLANAVSDEQHQDDLTGILNRFIHGLQEDCNIPEMKAHTARASILRALKNAIEEFRHSEQRNAELHRLSNVLDLAK